MRISASLVGTLMSSGLIAAGVSCAGGDSDAAGVGGATGSSSLAGTSGASGTTASSSSSGTTSTSSTGSSSSSTGGVPGAGPAGAFPFPSVVDQGGPVVAAPKIVTVTFPNDPMASSLQSFGASLASSSYWNTIRAGYCDTSGNCVGDGPTGTSVVITTAPATKYTDSGAGSGGSLKKYIKGLITAGTLPMPDANTIYTFYFPPTTTVTLDGSASCQGFDAYHSSLRMTAFGQDVEVYYAIVPECPAAMMTPQITTLQNTTLSASHEIIETATDPSVRATTHYLDVDNEPATWAWDDVFGGEVADLCVDFLGLGQDEATEDGFTVQRSWSIQNASAGKNPCVPIPAGEVYFNTFTTVSVVTVDVGHSVDVEIDALADGPMGAWTVMPQDWTDPGTPYLSFAIQGGTSTHAGPEVQMKSGDKKVLTVTLLEDPMNAPDTGADGVIVSASGSTAHVWPFVVLTPAEAADAGVMKKRRDMHASRKRSHLRERARLFGWGR